VKGTTVSPAVSAEEVPTPAAELVIHLEPQLSDSPLEEPTPAAELAIHVEPYDGTSLG
jgi:hypothetical protein